MKSKFQWILLSVLVLIAGVCFFLMHQEIRAAENVNPQTSTIQLVGLSVALPSPGDKYGGSKAPSLRPGTQLFFECTAPKGMSLIGWEKNDAVITTFKDSSGKDLNQKPKAQDGFSQAPGFGHFATFNDEHTAAVISLTSPLTPTAKATSLTVDAQAVFIAAAGTKDEEVKNVALKKGGRIKFPKLDFEIVSTEEKQTWEKKDVFVLELKVAAKLDMIKSLTFFDENGDEIKSSRNGYSTFTMNDKPRTTVTYQLDKKIDTATVKITLYQELKKITLPVKTQVTIGL